MASTIEDATRRVEKGDLTLKTINAFNENCEDAAVITLMRCLIKNPNRVTRVVLDRNKLTDQAGMLIASFVTISTTLEVLSLKHNNFTSRTHLAIACALRLNTSLRFLAMAKNERLTAKNRFEANAYFVRALHMNPHRPHSSEWYIYDSSINAYKNLKKIAERLEAPTMVTQLSACQFWHDDRLCNFKLAHRRRQQS